MSRDIPKDKKEDAGVWQQSFEIKNCTLLLIFPVTVLQVKKVSEALKAPKF